MARLSLSFFGAFQATLEQQRLTNFRSTNVQGLLVYLAMQAARPFPRDVLATLFWPDENDSTARANLRQSLYQLRKVLRDDQQEQPALSGSTKLSLSKGPFLLINRHTIQFNADSDYKLDVGQFLAALTQGDLETAVSHYHGELLPGFTCDSLDFEEWLRGEREQLHRLALEALSDWTEQHLANGRFQPAQAAAQRQIELDPWREEGHQQLMLALAASGERSAALTQYQALHQLLADELGTDLSTETIHLAEQITAGDIAPLLPLPSAPPPHNLLAATTTYFGRSEEQIYLIEQLQHPEHRFVTLVGEGGLGKSRLAQEVAWQLREQFRDGVWFVPLAGLIPDKDGAQIAGLQDSIATTIAQAMNHSLSGQQSPQHQLRTFLHDRHALLILDNFEHVLDGADLLLDLLQHAPALTLLCTSREPLGFMAEWVYQLEQLPLPPPLPADPTQWLKAVEVDIASYASVQLFVDRATRANGRFALTTANENQIAHLCHLVSGSPLGLELAAASLRQRPLAQLIQTIESSLASLAISLRDVPLRHRSLRAVFESSWELLTAVEQHLFATLSIFRSGFDETAAQTIAGADPEQIQNLCQKSLLQSEGGRTLMHEYLRQLAAEKRQALKLDNVPLDHSTYYLHFVAQQEAPLVGETPQEATQKIALELDNIRRAWQTAVTHQQTHSLLPCLQALADYYQIRGLYREAVQQFSQAAQLLRSATPLRTGTPHDDKKLLAHLLTHQAGAANRLSQYTAAITLIEQALALATQIDDQWVHGKLHIYWGEALWRQGELAEAEAKLNQAWETAEALESRPLAGSALFHLGIVHDYKGNYETALGYLDNALLIWRLLGNRRQQGFTLNSIGFVAHRLPHLATRAQITLTEALSISEANRDVQGQSMALNNLSLLATNRKDYEAAKSYLAKALQLAEHVGDTHGQALLIYNLGENAREAGWLHEAKLYADLALQLSHQIGDQRREGRTLQLLGDLEKENGRFQQAITYYHAALTILQKAGHSETENAVKQAIKEITRILNQQEPAQSPLLK